VRGGGAAGGGPRPQGTLDRRRPSAGNARPQRPVPQGGAPEGRSRGEERLRGRGVERARGDADAERERHARAVDRGLGGRAHRVDDPLGERVAAGEIRHRCEDDDLVAAVPRRHVARAQHAAPRGIAEQREPERGQDRVADRPPEALVDPAHAVEVDVEEAQSVRMALAARDLLREPLEQIALVEQLRQRIEARL
jgi:hypothetical protein